MDTEPGSLETRARRLTEAARGLRVWTREAAHTSSRVAHEADGLYAICRQAAVTGRRLAEAAGRRMCVGVFGPSQAGKSYLVSALARRPGEPLRVRMDDRGRDFLKEINPPGDRESTGLVTRFTTMGGDVLPGFPVQARFLTETDLVKVLGNSFFLDFDRNNLTIPVPGPEEADAIIREAEAVRQPGAAPHLDEEAVFDLQLYFERNFSGQSGFLRRSGYWRAAMRLLPDLALPGRIAFYRILWGNIDDFTHLFRLLATDLERLGHAVDGFLPEEALIPRDDSVIDVAALNGLDISGRSSEQPDLAVVVTGHDGHQRQVQIARPNLAALIAELTMVMIEPPHHFFDHADLLDFPGARSRLQLRAVAEASTQGNEKGLNPMRELLLRGKVAYLFERYAEERELTGLLLCLPPGPLEVKDLVNMLRHWIRSTHGDTPEARATQSCALFLVLSKFDVEFVEKDGEDEDALRGRFGRRLEASLIEPFGRDVWPMRWGNGPFCNSYMIRNPGVRQDSIIAYHARGPDSDGEGGGTMFEAGIRKDAISRVRRMASYFEQAPEVCRHFAEPADAWNALMQLNDGGVGYLVESLERICQPTLKERQISERLAEQAGILIDNFSRFHEADAEERTRASTARARRLSKALLPCMEQNRFGGLLSIMQVTDDDVRELFLSSSVHPGEEEGAWPASPHRRERRIRIDDNGEDDAPSLPGATDGMPASRDRFARFAEEVTRHWRHSLRMLGDEARVLDALRIDRASLSDLAEELGIAADRLELTEQIAAMNRAHGHIAQADWEGTAARQVRITTVMINNFVSWLGAMADGGREGVFEPPPDFEGRGQDLPSLGEKGEETEVIFCNGWLSALRRMIRENSGYKGGRDITPQLNEELGNWLRKCALGTGDHATPHSQ